LFADAQRVGVGEGEADVVGQGAQVRGVVVEAFELEDQRAQPLRRLGHRNPEGILHGKTVRQGVSG